MDKLPKDMIGKLVNELSPQDFINFCASNTSENVTRICNMNELWDRRLRKDFPYIMENFKKFGKEDAKTSYLSLFQRFSKMAETFTEVILNQYNDMRKFFSPEFKKFLYENFYDLCAEAVKRVLKDGYEDGDFLPDSVQDVYYNKRFNSFRVNYFPGMKDDEERFTDYWQDVIESPLEEFVKETINFLKLY